jgi:two-component system, chemotaxis family, protein-glutamate methylesterase/glutaminase
LNSNLRNIIVIGASSGGFEALKTLAAGLPPDLQAALFIVWHMSPDVRSVLPQVLSRETRLPVVHAYDHEPIVLGRMYVAPPDHHLLVEPGRLRVTRGPRENRFRPAVDPLFRSAAYAYGPRVIGVVLSGALDDGTAGLWTVKQRGGVAIVQDPYDAEVPSMPRNAMREVAVDYCVPVAELGALLVRLSREQVPELTEAVMKDEAEDEKTAIEIRIAAQDSAFESGIMKFGELTPYTCPECHGVLSRLRDGQIVRYRCHTGHAYSADSLLTTITENIEDSLYDAIRGIEESVMLLNHLGDHFAEVNQPKLAALYFKKAKEAESRARGIRQSVLSHEQLSKDRLQQQSETLSLEQQPDLFTA